MYCVPLGMLGRIPSGAGELVGEAVLLAVEEAD
jgi:hypothetical protein